jgi:hypothetical protein
MYVSSLNERRDETRNGRSVMSGRNKSTLPNVKAKVKLSDKFLSNLNYESLTQIDCFVSLFQCPESGMSKKPSSEA